MTPGETPQANSKFVEDIPTLNHHQRPAGSQRDFHRKLQGRFIDKGQRRPTRPALKNLARSSFKQRSYRITAFPKFRKCSSGTFCFQGSMARKGGNPEAATKSPLRDFSVVGLRAGFGVFPRRGQKTQVGFVSTCLENLQDRSAIAVHTFENEVPEPGLGLAGIDLEGQATSLPNWGIHGLKAAFLLEFNGVHGTEG